MPTFYPGPSQTHPALSTFFNEAVKKGYLSMNHRSDTFVKMNQRTQALMRKKLNIPEEYTIAFCSSATECWEILGQSLEINKSIHLYNGAFGEKWKNRMHNLGGTVETQEFAIDGTPNLNFNSSEKEVICITYCETSNGTQWQEKSLTQLRANHEDAIIAIDATASMGGIALPISTADFWFASVQKCFGLPAGMAVMLLGPKLKKLNEQRGIDKHYNSLTAILDNAQKYQTTHTPNVMNIFFLGKVMEMRKSISDIDKNCRNELRKWESFIDGQNKVNFLVEQEDVRSNTVLAITANENDVIDTVKQRCFNAGYVVGNGYGKWKNNSFRIANFPEIKPQDHSQLRQLLKVILK